MAALRLGWQSTGTHRELELRQYIKKEQLVQAQKVHPKHVSSKKPLQGEQRSPPLNPEVKKVGEETDKVAKAIVVLAVLPDEFPGMGVEDV
eukprot:3297373-Amphidinium_carterae.2